MNVLVSRCLLAVPCRYDGKTSESYAVARLCARDDVRCYSICPEVAGGLPVPRPPAERVGNCVVTQDGTDVTAAYNAGARQAAELAEAASARLAILKSKSPSCGSGLIYDGTFSRRLVPGQGVTAERLAQEGVVVVSEKTIEACVPSVEHPIAISLGSGLAAFAERVKPVRRIPYERVFEGVNVPARADYEVTIGTINDVPVVVYPGRLHLYEGYSASEVSALVRHARHLGCRTMIFAAATGAIAGKAPCGLGVISDQLNLSGQSPLLDPDDRRSLEGTFVDMRDAYTPYLRLLAQDVAENKGIALSEGVLAGIQGPAFESPAEAKALGMLGASYTAMSLVNEVTLAHALGMQVLGVTLSANEAGAPGVSHQTVAAFGQELIGDFDALITGVLERL